MFKMFRDFKGTVFTIAMLFYLTALFLAWLWFGWKLVIIMFLYNVFSGIDRGRK